MSQRDVAFIFAAALLLAMATVVLLLMRQQDRLVGQRDSAYRSYCTSRGYQYVPSRPGAEKPYINLLGFFNQGSNRSWGFEVSGVINGRPFTAFEYTMAMGSRYRKTFAHALMKWELDGAAMPDFLVVPADQVTSGPPGRSDRVEFPDDQLFTFGFAVIASNADPVREFLSPTRRQRLRTHLIADPEQYIRGSSSTLFWYRDTYLPPPEQLDQFIAAGESVRAALLDD